MFHLRHGARRLCSPFLKRFDLASKRLVHGSPIQMARTSKAIRWDEAWEIARPWFKDPRVHQPQRMFHPDGWAAGELDLVLRWDGRIRLVDIKSGHSGGALQKVSNINCGFMLGSGRGQVRKARLPIWKDGTSQARNESITMRQVKKNLLQWIRSFSTSTNR